MTLTKKNITCLGVNCYCSGGDTLLSIFLLYYYFIDFSDDKKYPNENIYGYCKYKGFVFFCLNNCKSVSHIFNETKDSVRVKNSIYLKVKIEDKGHNDDVPYWWFKIKNDKIIEYE